MKKLLFSLILTTLVSTGLKALPQLPNYGQTISSTPWKVVTENSVVSIKYGYKIHKTPKVNHRYLVLHVINKTNQEITVTFTKKMWYNGNEVIPDDHKITLTIPANSHIEGDVNGIDRSLLIFSENFGSVVMGKLTNYEINIIN